MEHAIYKNIISSLAEGIIVIGFDGKIILCNSTACEALHLQYDTVIGKSIADLLEESKENDEFFDMLLDTVYTKKKNSRILPFITENALKYFSVSTSFLINEEKKTALIAFISDQTETADLFISTKRLGNQVVNLMNSFVEVMVTEFEEQSVYNANHTKSMVNYASAYLKWLDSRNMLTTYTMENTAPFLMSVWLHDVGKLLVPKEILDKPTRLGHSADNVKHRIEIAELMLKIRQLSGADTSEESEKKLYQLKNAEKLIFSVNTAGFIEDETIQTLKDIAEIKCYASDGSECPLLYPDELEALTIKRGTLTDSERKIIESHVSMTAKMLSKVEFRGDYKKVPLWAGGHHELLDGSGYPQHLQGEQIPWETRLLTIIDIYDALTAEDRPYKPPMPPEKAFSVLRDMAQNGKIDGEILNSFYESGAWQKTIS